MQAPALRKDLVGRTIELARNGWGKTHPNPMVGALIVEDGEVVAEGWHERAGGLHAEIVALKNLGRQPHEGAELYVSLEPCSSTGRTPPCTVAILEAGIRKVVVGAIDPDPRHSGKGLEWLRKKGIEVLVVPPEWEELSNRLNFIFNHFVVGGHPLVALKMATSANGMVAERAGFPSRVTGEDARADVMRWRSLFPSICVGSGTVIADDPSLTARLPDQEWCPVRIVVDSSLDSLSASFAPRRVYTDEYSDRTVVLTNQRGMNNSEGLSIAENLGIRVMELPGGQDGRVRPSSIRQAVADLGLCATYCEGGPALARSMLDEGEVDYLFSYVSPKVFNSSEALHGPDLSKLSLHKPIEVGLGEDLLRHGYL